MYPQLVLQLFYTRIRGYNTDASDSVPTVGFAIVLKTRSRGYNTEASDLVPSAVFAIVLYAQPQVHHGSLRPCTLGWLCPCFTRQPRVQHGSLRSCTPGWLCHCFIRTAAGTTQELPILYPRQALQLFYTRSREYHPEASALVPSAGFAIVLCPQPRVQRKVPKKFLCPNLYGYLSPSLSNSGKSP